MKLFRTSPRLFVSIVERMKGSVISSQRLSDWISDCIKACYDVVDSPSMIRTLLHQSASCVSSIIVKLNNIRHLKGYYLGVNPPVHDVMPLKEVSRSNAAFGKAKSLFC